LVPHEQQTFSSRATVHIFPALKIVLNSSAHVTDELKEMREYPTLCDRSLHRISACNDKQTSYSFLSPLLLFLKKIKYAYEINSRGSTVGMATGYGLEGFESREGQEFSFLHVVHIGSGAQPASYIMDTGGTLPVGKAAGT
jgi:hypothetical protein